MRPWTTLSLALMVMACDSKETPTDTAPPEDTGETGPADADGDGVTVELDCDDTNAEVYPGAVEQCDELDNNCDGEIDEGYDTDADSYTTCAGDCNDDDAAVNPGATEVPYDGIDQDCSGADDDDLDGDGYTGSKAGGGDCNDDDAAINPDAEEVPYDGIDQDCNGADLKDVDGDGYDGLKAGGDDCDDDDPTIYPGIDRLDFMNDGIDADCDGTDGAPWSAADADRILKGDASSLIGGDIAICDLDGDSIDDIVAVGLFHGSYAGVGAVFMGAGSSSWTSSMAIADADAIITDYGDVTAGTAFLGGSVACGDFDGDGTMDLAISRGEIDYADYYVTEFSVYIFSGSDLSGTLYPADATAELTYALGVPTDTATVYSRYIDAGDTDGDGVDELMISMTYGDGVYSTCDGNLWVIDASSAAGSGLKMDDYVTALIAPDYDDAIGAVQVTDDYDGDGRPDLFIHQGYYYDETTEDFDGRGSFLQRPGDDTVENLAYASIVGSGGEAMGYTATFGDFDGDGLDDAILSGYLDSTYDTYSGELFFFSDVASTLTGAGLDAAKLADATVLGQTYFGELGYQLASLGDYDSDGADDLLVIERYGGVNLEGRAYVVSGSMLVTSGLDIADVAILEIEGEQWAATTRFAVGFATGDLDSDGYTDFAIGDNYAGSASEGQVYIYLSSDIGL